MISLICGIQKEGIQMNLFIKQRLIDLENKFMVTKGASRMVREGLTGSLGLTYRHHYVQWINNKDLLYSIGSYMQYVVVTYKATIERINVIFYIYIHTHISVQFSHSFMSDSLQLCGSTPGFPVHHQLPDLAQAHVHRVSKALQPSQPLLSPSPPAVNLSQHQGLFQ